MKKPTLWPRAAAIFISVAIVGVIPLFSILWIAAAETPARCPSCCSDQPRSARALATLVPMLDTVWSMPGKVTLGVVIFLEGNGAYTKRNAPSRGLAVLDLRRPLCLK